MRTTLITATSVALVIVAVTLTQLHAQQGGPSQRPPVQGGPEQGSAPPQRGANPSSAANQTGIAVIDVTYILDHYSRLKQETEKFKRALDDAEAQLKKEREVLAKKAEKLKTFKPGTPDFKALEEEIIKAESDWKLRVNRQKGEFAERDANNFLKAYQDLQAQVKAYADRNNISLVLRFNGARVDPTNPQAVQMELSKMVMYYHKDIDITDQVLTELNRNAAIASPPARAPARR